MYKLYFFKTSKYKNLLLKKSLINYYLKQIFNLINYFTYLKKKKKKKKKEKLLV